MTFDSTSASQTAAQESGGAGVLNMTLDECFEYGRDNFYPDCIWQDCADEMFNVIKAADFALKYVQAKNLEGTLPRLPHFLGLEVALEELRVKIAAVNFCDRRGW